MSAAYRQTAPRLPAVAMDDPIFKECGWWAGVSTRCQYPLCRGVMTFAPPDQWVGRIYCTSCGRSTHDVRERLYVPVNISEIPKPKRGRPFSTTTVDGRRVCIACNERPALMYRPRCHGCHKQMRMGAA